MLNWEFDNHVMNLSSDLTRSDPPVLRSDPGESIPGLVISYANRRHHHLIPRELWRDRAREMSMAASDEETALLERSARATRGKRYLFPILPQSFGFLPTRSVIFRFQALVHPWTVGVRTQVLFQNSLYFFY